MDPTDILRGARRAVLLAVTLVAGAAPARAQASGGFPEAATEEARPGLIRAGAFFLTPYLHIGTLGVDTNVFYTATDRQTDFIASGGPGLEIVRPFGTSSRLRLDGGLDYLYYARTNSQRKLNGYGTAQLNVEGVRTRLAIEERYISSFGRPGYEVNARVQQETEGTRAFLRRNLGDRFRLGIFGERSRQRTDSQDYLGTDLGQTLTEDRYQAGGELRMALSVKTQVVAGGEQGWYRFPQLPERDGDSTLAYAGFRTDTTALVSGEALAGYRWFRLDSGVTSSAAYASVDATWNVSPKTKLGLRYGRDLRYSAFSTSGPTPTNVVETGEVSLDKVLVSNVYLRLFARATRLRSDGEITIVPPGEAPVTDERRDQAREAGVELGYQFRTRVRMGLTASYTNRRSSFETFGIDGLLAGFTVSYNPPQPTFR